MMREHRESMLWMYVANIALGLWLLTSPAMLDYRSSSLAWSDGISGALIVVLGIVALFPRGDFWGRWGICLVGIWLLFAPLAFWAPTAFVYANDTIVGSLVIAFAILAPMMPGKAHHMAMMQPGPDVPPGWTYNPSGCAARLDIQPVQLVAAWPHHRAWDHQLLHLPIHDRISAWPHRIGVGSRFRPRHRRRPDLGRFAGLAGFRRGARGDGVHAGSALGLHGFAQPLAHCPGWC